MRYHPWGGTRYTSGTTPTARRYTGQIEDAAIGLYFYNARYYDSYLNRFIQADTIVPSPVNPQSLNRYSYVPNSPLRYTDPTGHKECDRFCEGERTDDRTVGSEYTGPYNTSLSPEEQMAIIESTPGFAAMPIVALINPGYAGRGVVSTIGYFLGSKGEVDVKGLQLAFYVGGKDNTKWWWGAASNNIQYLLDRFTEGDMPTSGKEWLEMGNDVLWNGATGQGNRI